MDEHYYTENPSSKLVEKQFTYSIKNITLSFTSVSGVFSFSNSVDKASELLIKHFTPSGSKILDLGCGYGPIGLFLKALFPSQSLVLCDINERAVEYSALNAKKNNLNVTTLKSNLYENIGGATFDDIVSNPPIAAGKKLNTVLIDQAFDHLNPNGALWLVAFHNKGGATLKDIMKNRFGNVEDIEKSGRIRVYKSIRHPAMIR